MKKYFEEPIVETTVIVDVVSDLVETPESQESGVL